MKYGLTESLGQFLTRQGIGTGQKLEPSNTGLYIYICNLVSTHKKKVGSYLDLSLLLELTVTSHDRGQEWPVSA